MDEFKKKWSLIDVSKDKKNASKGCHYQENGKWQKTQLILTLVLWYLTSFAIFHRVGKVMTTECFPISLWALHSQGIHVKFC